LQQWGLTWLNQVQCFYQHPQLFGIFNPEAVTADLKSANANSNICGM
jgi:hypothetical protein